MEPHDFQPGRILEVLKNHGVEFVLIGGIAATSHGSPFPTEDVDITPDDAMANLTRLSDALREVRARVCAEGVEGGLPFDHDAESLAHVGVWNLTTDFGNLYISFRPSGTTGFADLARSAEERSAFGIIVRIASLADIIRSKQAANRPKDQLHLPVLREILSHRLDGK